jgi:LacI family transcriptional regulator
MPQGPFRVADIAAQAGLSAATVDRVLHGRAHASGRARRQVEGAVAELERQATQVRLGASTLVLDLVVQAPERFSREVRGALEAELPALRPVTLRARSHLSETADPDAVARVLDRVAEPARGLRPGAARSRSGAPPAGPAGVVLKAPDDPVVAAAVDRLADRGIPVVTLVTDVRGCRRAAYVGLDNAAAGATAATLVHGHLRDAPGAVLLTISRSIFFGERERRAGFEAELSRLHPGREVVVLDDADGLDRGVGGLARELLGRRRDIVGVYSIGGGNRAVVDAFATAGIRPLVYVGHDLDADNLDLLRSGGIDLVLHHDLRADLRWAARQLLRAHHLLPGAPTSMAAPVQVVTRHNIPWRLSADPT